MSEYKFSTLKYTTADNTEKSIVIPTIQSIEISVSNTILTKPTITGHVIAQYANTNPASVTINILLQTDKPTYTYAGETFATADLLSNLKTIAKGKLTFDLITTDRNLFDYLQNLVIQSQSFSKSSGGKNTIVYSITCLEVKFAELGWEIVPAEVLGVKVGAEDTVKTYNLSLKREANAETRFHFNPYQLAYTGAFILAYLLRNNTPGELVGEYIDKNIISYYPDYYLESSIVINLATGPSSYIINTNFELVDNDVKYNANFGDIVIDVSAENESVEFEPNGVVSTISLISLNTLLLLNEVKTDTAYNLYNQYSALGVTPIFDKFIDRKTMFTNIATRLENADFVKKISDGVVPYSVNKQNLFIKKRSLLIPGSYFLMAKDINKLYNYNIKMSGMDDINGTATGFNITHRSFTTFNVTSELGNWYSSPARKYTSYLISVVIGTNLYIFVISPEILTPDVISGTKST